MEIVSLGDCLLMFCEFERFNCLNLKGKEKFWRLLYIIFTGKIFFLVFME